MPQPTAATLRSFHGVLLNTAIANLTTSFLWFAFSFWVYLETRSVLAYSLLGGSYMLLLAILGVPFGTLVDRTDPISLHREVPGAMTTLGVPAQAPVKVFDDMPSSLAAVQAGTIQAAINDNGVLFDYAKTNPTTKVVKEFETGEQYGLMAQKGNTAMITVINEVLAAAKKDGSYNTIYKKWFGSEPQA